MRNGVDKSERNEINRALLLPVWQAIRSKANVRIRIEKAQLCHETPSVLSQHG